MSADSQVPLSIDPDTDHPIAGDAVLYTAINDAAFGGTVEESYQDPAPSLTWRFRIVGHQGLFNHSAEAWRSRIISRPAPEPEPQWEPGTTGTAAVVREGKNGGAAVARKTRGTWVTSHAGVRWFVTHEATIPAGNLVPEEDVTDFVPDGDIKAAIAELTAARDLVQADLRDAQDALDEAYQAAAPDLDIDDRTEPLSVVVERLRKAAAPTVTREQVQAALEARFHDLHIQGWGPFAYHGTNAVMELLGDGAR